MWQILGFQLHVYGIVIAVSILVGYYAVIFKAQQRQLGMLFIESAFGVILVTGVIGSRLYHVISDFSYYQTQLLQAFQIWRGGLSIIGAVMGATLGLILFYGWQKPKLSLITYLDLSIFGLPIAQALGRIANYLNQELYGAPTQLPWSIYIDPSKRLVDFENFERYHPLFAYEMIFTAAFGVVVWLLESKYRSQPWAKIGSGVYFFSYLIYYCLARAGLDFFRLDKHLIPGLNLGSNQVVLLSIAGFIAIYLYCKISQNRYAK